MLNTFKQLFSPGQRRIDAATIPKAYVKKHFFKFSTLHIFCLFYSIYVIAKIKILRGFFSLLEHKF